MAYYKAGTGSWRGVCETRNNDLEYIHYDKWPSRRSDEGWRMLVVPLKEHLRTRHWVPYESKIALPDGI